MTSQSGTFLFPDDHCCFKTDWTNFDYGNSISDFQKTWQRFLKEVHPVLGYKNCNFFIKPQNHSTNISGFIFYFGFKILYQIWNGKKVGGAGRSPYSVVLSSFFSFPHCPGVRTICPKLGQIPNTHYSAPFSNGAGGPWIPVCSWKLQEEINMPKDIFTWRLIPRKHSVSGK